MSSSESKKLPLFCGKNSGLKLPGKDSSSVRGVTYSDWRYKLQSKCYSLGGGIWRYLVRETANLPVEVEDKYFGLLDVIVASLQDDALTTSKAAKEQNPRGILEQLDKKYFSQSRSSRNQAISSLVGVVQRAGQTIDDFVDEKKRLAREDLQSRIDIDELVTGSVTSGVLPEYHDLLGNIMSSDNVISDVTDLLPALRDKEKQLAKNRLEVDTTSSTALTACTVDDLAAKVGDMVDKKVQNALKAVKSDKGGKGGWVPWWKKHGVQKNHDKARKGGGKGKGKGGKDQRKCYNCNGYGHIAKDCRKKQEPPR